MQAGCWQDGGLLGRVSMAGAAMVMAVVMVAMSGVCLNFSLLAQARQPFTKKSSHGAAAPCGLAPKWRLNCALQPRSCDKPHCDTHFDPSLLNAGRHRAPEAAPSALRYPNGRFVACWW